MTAQPWEPRVARLEGAYEQVDKRLDSIDRRLDSLERKVDSLDAKFSQKFDGFQWRITSLIMGTWITLMLAIFFHKV